MDGLDLHTDSTWGCKKFLNILIRYQSVLFVDLTDEDANTSQSISKSVYLFLLLSLAENTKYSSG